MWRGWVAGWLVSVAGLGAIGQDAPTQTVAEAQRRLLQVVVSEIETDVPAAAQVGIRALKPALGRETDAVMAGLPTDAAATEARQRIAAKMPVTPPERSPNAVERAGRDEQQDVGVYGADITVQVT